MQTLDVFCDSRLAFCSSRRHRSGALWGGVDHRTRLVRKAWLILTLWFTFCSMTVLRLLHAAGRPLAGAVRAFGTLRDSKPMGHSVQMLRSDTLWGQHRFTKPFPVRKGILRCHRQQECNQGPRVRVHGKSGRAPVLFIQDGVVITVPTQWCLRNDLAPRLRLSTSARSAPAHTSWVGRARWHFTSASKARKLTCMAHAVTVGASTLEAPLHSATPS